MKIAITGKGGAGKTTVAGIVARTLAQGGRQVVAVDADPNPNLGMSLGLSQEELAKVDGIVNVLMRERAAHQHAHDEGAHEHAGGETCEPPPMRSADEIVTDMGVVGPDGVVLVETGRIERPSEGCLCCGSHGTTRRIFNDLSASDRVVVADLEAGVNDLIWAKPTGDDIVVIVTQPYMKSLEVAKRALGIARQMGVQHLYAVANRVQSADDVDRVRAALGDIALLEIPDDPAVAEADRSGRPAIDVIPSPPAVTAVRQLVASLLGEGSTV